MGILEGWRTLVTDLFAPKMHVSHTKNPYERVELKDEARRRLAIEERVRQGMSPQRRRIHEQRVSSVDEILADLRRPTQPINRHAGVPREEESKL